MHKPKREVTRRKYRAMKARFDELYNVKRIRYDDCVRQVAEEFFMSNTESVLKALRVADEELNTNQMEMKF